LAREAFEFAEKPGGHSLPRKCGGVFKRWSPYPEIGGMEKGEEEMGKCASQTERFDKTLSLTYRCLLLLL
jgi:hypothetical protein